MKICVIGNYSRDRQESMARFGRWICEGIRQAGFELERLEPKVIFGKPFATTLGGMAKWAGYMDKFAVFPSLLMAHARKPENANCIYHVIDHSNARYATALPADRTLITCHDVLAIRGGLGDPQVRCDPSPAGVHLQKWILKNLQRAPRIAFVSNATREDYLRLPKLPRKAAHDQDTQVIPIGLNDDFKAMDGAAARRALERFAALLDKPFFVHLGSALPRKNRIMAMRAFDRFAETGTGHRLLFAGAGFSAGEHAVLANLGSQESIHDIGKVSHDELCALYSLATALVFPSYSEGFGWPVIEAQACDCPVICSDRTALPEVAGKGAIICDAGSVIEFADAMGKVLKTGAREQLVAAGRTNLERFSEKNTRDVYMETYRAMMNPMQM